MASSILVSGSVQQLTIDGTSLFLRDGGKLFEFTINNDLSLTSVPFTLHYAAGADNLGSFAGLTFGPDGMLYASTRTANGNLDSSIGTDYVVKINPATGIASTFFAGPTNLNGGVNPTFLLFTTVPEPGTLTMAIVGGALGLGTWCNRRRRKAQAQESTRPKRRETPAPFYGYRPASWSPALSQVPGLRALRWASSESPPGALVGAVAVGRPGPRASHWDAWKYLSLPHGETGPRATRNSCDPVASTGKRSRTGARSGRPARGRPASRSPVSTCGVPAASGRCWPTRPASPRNHPFDAADVAKTPRARATKRAGATGLASN